MAASSLLCRLTTVLGERSNSIGDLCSRGVRGRWFERGEAANEDCRELATERLWIGRSTLGAKRGSFRGPRSLREAVRKDRGGDLSKVRIGSSFRFILSAADLKKQVDIGGRDGSDLEILMLENSRSLLCPLWKSYLSVEE